MGGHGCVRRSQRVRLTTSCYLQIDIRILRRNGWLEPGQCLQLRWLLDENIEAPLTIKTEPEQVILAYRRQNNEGVLQDIQYPVLLTRTPCPNGGERRWFVCPADGCSKRVAVLYGGKIFACRHCYQLIYDSQRSRCPRRRRIAKYNPKPQRSLKSGQ